MGGDRGIGKLGSERILIRSLRGRGRRPYWVAFVAQWRREGRQALSITAALLPQLSGDFLSVKVCTQWVLVHAG